MTDQDKQDIAEIVAGSSKKGNPVELKSVVDNIMRLFSTATFVGMTWVVTSMIGLREGMVEIKVKNEMFENFMKEPRFTKGDFNKEVLPLTGNVNANLRDIQIINEHAKKTDQRLNKIETKLEIIKSIDDLDP